MSDYSAEQALTDSDISAHSILFIDGGAGRNKDCQKYPREFVTLGLVVFCLSFWTVVIYSVAG